MSSETVKTNGNTRFIPSIQGFEFFGKLWFWVVTGAFGLVLTMAYMIVSGWHQAGMNSLGEVKTSVRSIQEKNERQDADIIRLQEHDKAAEAVQNEMRSDVKEIKNDIKKILERR